MKTYYELLEKIQKNKEFDVEFSNKRSQKEKVHCCLSEQMFMGMLSFNYVQLLPDGLWFSNKKGNFMMVGGEIIEISECDQMNIHYIVVRIKEGLVEGEIIIKYKNKTNNS